MTTFVSDTFTDTNGTALTSHTGGTGATWTRHASATNTGAPAIQSNALQTTELSVNESYYASGTPGAADYTVTLRYKYNGSSAGTIAGPAARMSTSADTGYFAIFFQSPTEVRLYKRVSGTLTQIGSGAALSPVSGESYDITIDVSGTTVAARVQVLGNSLWLTSAGTFQSGQVNCCSTTDSAISAAGKAGFWLSHASGTRDIVDNFVAVDSTTAFTVTGNFDFADLVHSGTFATGALSQLAGSITLDDFLNSGFLGLAPGRVDTAPFKNWSGTLLPGVTVPNVVFLKLDRSKPLDLANQTTAGDGVMTITNAALTPGTYYIMVSFDATGANIGAELVLAA